MIERDPFDISAEALDAERYRQRMIEIYKAVKAIVDHPWVDNKTQMTNEEGRPATYVTLKDEDDQGPSLRLSYFPEVKAGEYIRDPAIVIWLIEDVYIEDAATLQRWLDRDSNDREVMPFPDPGFLAEIDSLRAIAEFDSEIFPLFRSQGYSISLRRTVIDDRIVLQPDEHILALEYFPEEPNPEVLEMGDANFVRTEQKMDQLPKDVTDMWLGQLANYRAKIEG